MAARRQTLAAAADPLSLYELSVQNVDNELAFFSRTFRRFSGRDPQVMREDFCGTSALSLGWIKRRGRRAIGIDLDVPTLEWVRRNRLRLLGDDMRSRLRHVHGDVRHGCGETVDFVCAMNFSYLVFKTRPGMLGYFQGAYDEIADDGMLFLDLYGGTDAMGEGRFDREVDGFDYEWHQETFNPLTHETLCHISFIFKDGSRLERAFTYDWRLWTCP
ncbi:MAG: class I SAM-dependent methyltransferase, partial [Candidatus Xenobia bacterium]